MPFSVFQDPQGCDWPLGFVSVANNGTPVNIMKNVDPSNNNAPGTAISNQTVGNRNSAEYTPTCHKVTFQGMKPQNASSGNGMVNNAGYVYILRSLGPGNGNSGGSANRNDPGAMIYVLFPGSSVTIPGQEIDGPTISPYRYTIDADNDGDGALVTLLNCARG
jgi:hypothetical protein